MHVSRVQGDQSYTDQLVSHDVVMRLLFSDDLGLLDGETVPNNKEIRMFIRKMTMKHIQRWVSISKEMSVDDRPWNLTDSCLKSFANECSVFPIFDIAGIMEWTLNIFELASEMIFKASTRICFDTSLNCGKASTVEVAMTTTKMCSLISWKGLTEYTYLCGVIREGFRLARLSSTPINSTICMNQSAVINGHVLPAGVEFDLSTMRRSHFFGPEENEFKPERWMRSEDETAEEWEVRICDLEMADQLFYTGPDASPPKALARMIVFKLVTAFTLNLQVNLVPDQVPVSQAMSDQEPHIECPDHSLEVPSLRYMPEN